LRATETLIRKKELLAESICNQQQPKAYADGKTGVSAKFLRRRCYKRGAQQLLRLKIVLVTFICLTCFYVGGG
jgi:hypothetical protein